MVCRVSRAVRCPPPHPPLQTGVGGVVHSHGHRALRDLSGFALGVSRGFPEVGSGVDFPQAREDHRWERDFGDFGAAP